MDSKGFAKVAESLGFCHNCGKNEGIVEVFKLSTGEEDILISLQYDGDDNKYEWMREYLLQEETASFTPVQLCMPCYRELFSYNN